MMMYKKIVLTCCALASSLFFLANAEAAAKISNQPLDSIVATVNDVVITQSELDEAVQRIKKQLSASHTPMPSLAVIRKRMLDQIIERKLQLLLAEQAGIKVNEDEVTKVITGIADQNKMRVNELYQKLTAEGMTVDAYRKEIHDELTMQRIQQQEVGSRISVTPEEVNDFMRSATWKAYNNKEYHLEDILIGLPSAPSADDLNAAKKEANLVLTKIHQGMSFREIAAEESGGTHGLQGGDLGWLKLPQIPPAFSDPLVHMKPQDIMGPIATPNGFHIVKLTEVRNVNEHEDVATQHKKIEQLLYQRKMDEGLQTWITRIRGEAIINTNFG